MKTHSLYPLMFRPQYRDYLWGGDLIATRYNRANTPRPCAESWELCGLPGHESVVANGPFEGVGLGHLTQTFGRDLVGAKAPDPERFPLLVKILDVHSRLSVQVHPDAKAAASLGGEPKHEMWYLLDAAPNATLWAGLRPDADLANLAEPDLVNRWAEDDARPSACVSCNACLKTASRGHVNCPVMRDREEGEWAPL